MISAIEKLLDSRNRPTALAELANAAQTRGYLAGDLRRADLVLENILMAENAIATAKGERPRFVFSKENVDLFERSCDADILKIERRIEAERARLMQIARRRVCASLQRLPIAALAVIVKACVSEPPRFGARLVSLVNAREARLISLRPQPERGHDAVVVLRDPTNQSSIVQRAVELRRSLRELNATAGILVVSSSVEDSTRDQAGIPGDPVVELWGADDLALRMERLGLGFREHGPSIDPFDAAFFEGLAP